MPSKHPFRVIRSIVNDVLVSLDADSRSCTRVPGGGLLRRSSFCAHRYLYSVRSERQLMEPIDWSWGSVSMTLGSPHLLEEPQPPAPRQRRR